MNHHNWSATKQRLHPQSVAEISCHSVLSGNRIRQCGTSSGSRHKDTHQCLQVVISFCRHRSVPHTLMSNSNKPESTLTVHTSTNAKNTWPLELEFSRPKVIWDSNVDFRSDADPVSTASLPECNVIIALSVSLSSVKSGRWLWEMLPWVSCSAVVREVEKWSRIRIRIVGPIVTPIFKDKLI